MLIAWVILLPCCARRRDPAVVLEHVRNTMGHGDLAAAAREADSGYEEFRNLGPEWAWKFTIARATILYRQDKYEKALTLLASEPAVPPSGELATKRQWLEGLCYTSLGKFGEAEQRLAEAQKLCEGTESAACTNVLSARGYLEMERGLYAQAQALFERALAAARETGDQLKEADAFVDLSWSANEQTHFDEALNWAGAARKISLALGSPDLAQTALGDMGWAYYKLGDPKKALDMFVDAAEQAERIGDLTDQIKWLVNAGYIHLDSGDFQVAGEAFQRSLKLARQVNSREEIANSLIALAFFSEQTGRLEDAKRYAEEALARAQQDKNRRDEAYPRLVQGRIAARLHDTTAAETAFNKVASSPDSPVFLKWEAERSLARLYDDKGQLDSAAREYQTALNTFETARSELKHEDSRLPFLSNATRIYDDYVHFLVANNKTDDALRWADFSRARTLAEGLGYLPNAGSVEPPALDAKQIARRAGATLLFYWLGEKQSYLWAITPRKIEWFPLPPSKTIDAAVQQYREALQVQDVLASADRDGQSLYQMLVGPAQKSLPKNAKVFVIPDGSLNNLNFETLIVSESTGSEPKAPAPKLHYWIEDVTIANASSLRVLGAVGVYKRKHERSLLIVGNSVAPNHEYRELPHAAEQMKIVESHFSAAKKILSRENATPSAYLASSPEKFSYIHFVVHGKANQLSPLDSEIELSRDSAQDDSFKLYAREIVDYSKKNPLQAELVTISACYSAGDNPYSGEGLVGLSWAFIRAGAHNVAAALWEVSDASTVQLLDKFYDELDKGASPDDALRTAKLSLLRGKEYHNPFYWASFQLYVRLG